MDHIIAIGGDWFYTGLDIKKYHHGERGSITKELEQIKEIVQEEPVALAGRDSLYGKFATKTRRH